MHSVRVSWLRLTELATLVRDLTVTGNLLLGCTVLRITRISRRFNVARAGARSAVIAKRLSVVRDGFTPEVETETLIRVALTVYAATAHTGAE